MADYRKQWQEYRRLRNLTLAVTISMFLLAVISATAERFIPSGLTRLVVLSVFGTSVFSMTIVAWMRVEAWRCPRCGRSFVSRWRSKWGVFFVKQCANCGLEKFANG
jgi:predicted RNA-binding Zn-ribbon protein involved in translation (DUF1610 family)